MKYNEQEEDTFSFVLTPLIDVLMFMLLFFMIAYAKTSPYSLSHEIRMPKSSSSLNSGDKQKPLIIEVTKTGGIIYNNKTMSVEDLTKELTLEKNKDQSIFIQGDKDAPYEYVINVLDLTKKTKFSKVYLLTQKNNA